MPSLFFPPSSEFTSSTDVSKAFVPHSAQPIFVVTHRPEREAVNYWYSLNKAVRKLSVKNM